MHSSVFLFCVFHFSTVATQAPPTIIKVSSNYNTVEAGKSFTLKCRAENAETIWFKDGRQLDPSTNNAYSLDDQDLVLINPQSGGQLEGLYTCKVTNEHGTTELGYSLRVLVILYVPGFLYAPRSNFYYNIDGFRKAWANCRAPKSVPVVFPTWINGSSGLPINKSDPRVTVMLFNSGGIFSQMVINPADKYDSGRWGCRAKHALGTETYWFNLTLYGPPPPSRNMRVKQHHLNGFIMEWDYLRNDLEFYDINITEVVTKETKHFVFKENLVPFLQQYTTYTFKNLTRGTVYEIVMRATDLKQQVGHWSSVFKVTTVTTISPLFLAQLPENVYVGEYSNTELVCNVQAEPAPTFTWFRNNVVISPSDNGYNQTGNRIIIMNVTKGEKNNDAKYKCKATNSEGSLESRESRLHVEWIGVEFVFKPGNKMYYITKSFIRISVLPPPGYRQPQLIWSKGNTRLSSFTHPNYANTLYRSPTGKLYHALDISKPGATAESVYHVEAYNQGGSVKASFSLVMALAPQSITYFSILSEVHSSIVLEWNLPTAIEKIANLGSSFKYRTDIHSFEIEWEDQNGNKSSLKTVGEYKDDKLLTKKAVLTNIKTGMEYLYRIRSIDRGNQISAWSALLKHTIPTNLPPYITKGPKPKYNPIEGGDVNIPCSSSATPPATIVWFKDNVTLSASNHIVFQNDGGLLLRNVTTEDNGEYNCVARNVHSETRSKTASLTTVYFHKTFQYTHKTAGFYDKDGFRDAIVLCLPPLSYPLAKVLWTNGTDNFLKYSSKVVKDDGYVITGKKYFSVKILDAKNFIGSEIGCAAYNPTIGFNGNYVLALTKIVQFGSLEITNLKYEVLSPTKIKVSWHINENVAKVLSIWSGIKKLQTVEVLQNFYEMTDARDDVLYTFVVMAVGNQGGSSAPVNVSMTGESATLTKEITSINRTIMEGANVSLSCDFNGFPYPRIKWFKNDVEIGVSDDSFAFLSYRRTITLVNVSSTVHGGEYHCVGYNIISPSARSKTSLVEVAYIGKTFRFGDVSKTFLDQDGGRSVSFKCGPPQSYPKAVVTWLKDDNALSGTKYKATHESGFDTLKFDATPPDVGVYSCLYSNIAGSRVHHMNLSLHDGPLMPQTFEVETMSWNFVILKWKPPSKNMDAFKLSYDGQQLLLDGDITSVRVNSLKENLMYEFQLVVVNDGKDSLPATLRLKTNLKPLIGLTSKIRNVEVQNIDSKGATLSWLAPSNLNGSHPLEIAYSIEYCLPNNTCNTVQPIKQTHVRLTSLQSSSTYTFYVYPHNELNVKGPKLEGSFWTLQDGVVSAILNFKVVLFTWNSITLQWDEPDSSDLLKINSYILEMSWLGGNSVERVDRNKKEIVKENLLEGIEYTFGLYPITATGPGPRTHLSQLTVDLGDLGPVSRPTVSLVPGYEDVKARVNWQPPQLLANNPKEEVTYTVSKCLHVKCTKYEVNSNLSLPLRALTGNTTYNITIKAFRADRKNASSVDFQFTTASKHKNPSTPQIVEIRPSSNSTDTKVSWHVPFETAGTDPSSMKYRLSVCNGDECKHITVNFTQFVLKGLKQVTRYTISLAALSFRGEEGTAFTGAFITATAATLAPSTTATSTISSTEDFGPPIEVVSSGLSSEVIAGIVIAVIIVIVLIVTAVFVYMKTHGKGTRSMSYGRSHEMNRRR